MAQFSAIKASPCDISYMYSIIRFSPQPVPKNYFIVSTLVYVANIEITSLNVLWEL